MHCVNQLRLSHGQRLSHAPVLLIAQGLVIRWWLRGGADRTLYVLLEFSIRLVSFFRLRFHLYIHLGSDCVFGVPPSPARCLLPSVRWFATLNKRLMQRPPAPALPTPPGIREHGCEELVEPWHGESGVDLLF